MSLFRISPELPVHAYKTYGLVAPVQTHWHKATCEEFGCEAFRFGWITRVPADSEQAGYIRRHSGRSFEETAPGEFTFKPGQTCFGAANHKVKLEREPLYLVRGGDWRGNPSGESFTHKTAENWVEDFGEHQEALSRRVQRG